MGDSYFDTAYKTRVEFYGVSIADRTLQKGISTFERFLKTAATRQKIKIGKKNLYVSIQTLRLNELGDKHEKIVLASLDSGIDVGTIFKWNDKNWLVLTKEDLTINTHIKGKIRECNHLLKWNKGKSIYTIPAHILTSGVGEKEQRLQGILFPNLDSTAIAIIPFNSITSTLKKGQRFIIGKDSQEIVKIKPTSWKVVGINDVSIPKLRILVMEEDLLDVAKDDLERKIADKYTPDVQDGVIEIEGVVYSIQGPSSVFWDEEVEYIAKKDQILAEEIEFTVLDNKLFSLKTAKTENPSKIKVNNKGLVGEGKIIVAFSPEINVSKTVAVKSYWS